MTWAGRALSSDWIFVPADPPRASVLCLWEPAGDTGMFAVPLDVVAISEQTGARSEVQHRTIDVVVARGDRLVGESVPAAALCMTDAVELLAGLDEVGASRSLAFWARATQAALGLIARGRLVAAVTGRGGDAWRVDPLEPADHQVLAALAEACPPEAHALAPFAARGSVVDPAWLVRCWFDAVADAWVRTAAAPLAVGTHLFAATEFTPAEPLRPWVAAAFGHLTSATRLGLRVEVGVVPDESDESPGADAERAEADAVEFTVVLQLRSARDPSLVVDVDDLEELDPSVADRLGRGAAEELLVALARASGHWSLLGRALDEELGSLVVTVDDLEQLLEAAGALEASGVEVLWPAAFTADFRPRLVATGAPPAVAGGEPLLGLASILDFRWQVLCDGIALSDDDIAALADAKRSLVWMRGRWVRTDGDVLARIRSVPDGLEGPAGLAAALAGEFIAPDGTAIEVAAEGFAEALRSRLGELAGLREEPEPPGLEATLRPYQRRGVAWMVDLCRSGLGGVLADDMGLGKTIQVIAAHLVLRSGATVEAAGSGPTLVVCPTSLLGNWAREIERFAPGVPVRRLAGSDRNLDLLSPDEIVLVTYGVMRRMVEDLADHTWGVVVADEAQHLKNPRARTSRAIRTIPAAARIALTGTPVENRLSELWSLLDWTTPGLLGSYDRFRTEFSIPIERRGSRSGTQRLATLTKPFMLRRRKTDPAIEVDLPSRTQHDLSVPLTAEQLSLYEALVRESLSQITGTEGIARQGLVFKLLTGLKQIANHPGQFLHETDGPLAARSGKLDAAVELVTAAVEGDERVLVFSQYVAMCHLLARRFEEADLHAEVLHGGLSADARDRLVERFQAGEVPVLVLSIKAGGTGLNLTAATQVIHFDRWWNPAVEDQATDRAWRIGQTKPVVVHRLISEGTIDERIAEMIERKRALAESVVGSGEAWIGDLDDDDLAELVSLRLGAGVWA